MEPIKCKRLECSTSWESWRYPPNRKWCSPECRQLATLGRLQSKRGKLLLPWGQNTAKEYRRIIYAHYGRHCAMCGATKQKMDIDHVFEDGPEERSKLHHAKMLRKIIEEGFPNRYQILCRSCNIEKSRIAQGGTPFKKF